MAKSNFWTRLIRREKKDLGGATITITQSGQAGGSASVSTSAGAGNVRPIPVLGRFPLRAQYWITGSGVLVSIVLAAGLTAWVDGQRSYYNNHLTSMAELKGRLVDLQADSYKLSLGLDAFAPQAYLEQKAVTDAFVFMRSSIFSEYPELKGKARDDLDGAWTEWVGLKGPRDKLTELHIALLTVRGKFAGSRAGANDAVATLRALVDAKGDSVSPETVESAKLAAGHLVRVKARLDNSDANISFGRSAADLDEYLVDLGKEIKVLASRVDGVKDPELKKKLETALKFIGPFASSSAKLNSLLVSMDEFRSQSGVLSNGAGRVLQLADYAEVRMHEELDSLGKLNWLVVALGLLALLSLIGLGLVSNNENKKRTFEAKNENEANQRAIMTLLDEIANLADGDLTVRATVTEEITGAIADSVNFAISELSTLVNSIKTAASQISDAAGKALRSSTQLLDISGRQAQEIGETGRSVLRITESIEQVSQRMEDSKRVAMDSVESSERGMQAVTASIDGIQSIRTNVDETAKRIKRLTEQSAQISEIVELIADISERTSVLAINATVQATKAGAAGKGFKVVADSVQDLANQASDATRRIGALINAIQTDIQGAGSAMEKTTDEATRGAQLAEATGEVFGDIQKTSKALNDIVAEVNEQIGQSARSAADVSQTMKRVLESVAESSEATKATGEAIEAINKLSDQLRESVSGFQV